MRWLWLTGPILVALAGCAGQSNRTDSFADENAVAHKLYVVKCAKCHKFYDPAKYSDEDWKTWMGKMSKKAKLSEGQAQMLSRYIEETFRGGIKPNSR